jgi:general secretion pathway protein N
MKRAWTLAILGVLAFLILLVATLPARVLLDRIPGVQATGVRGSIWSGQAASVSVQGLALGQTRWKLFALPLLRGRLDMDVELHRPDGAGAGRCSISLKQHVDCARVNANLPIEALNISSLPRGWTGRLNVDLSKLELDKGWPIAARGQVELLELAQPAASGARSLGSYRVEFPASTDAGATEKALVGALADTGGPLNVVGTVRLSPDHTYVIDGRVAPRSDAPIEVARSIEYLGLPDAQGRREFSLAGSL